ncbi:M3 family oligoendopeptidase [bacterium]|nr:M3 family oligoendopeptidase [bacterium]
MKKEFQVIKTLSTGGMTLAISVILFGCALTVKERQLEKFIAAHLEKTKPLRKELNLAYWGASTTGNSEDYDRLNKLELEISRIYSNPKEFARLKHLKESPQVKDPRLLRQLDRLYDNYLENQIEPELLERIIGLSTKIAQQFHTFRSVIEGEKVTANDINKILTTEMDSHKRELAWRASKQVGKAIAADLIQLVKLRNGAARKLGFENYHALSLAVGEQNEEELDQIFQELYELTSEPFARLKGELDGVLANQYGIAASELMPWHYHDPFFQRAPLVYDVDLDVFYGEADVRELAEKFYASISLPVDSILANSDLYERKGKNQHAFSMNVDREGDVRILCNLKNDERWMETVLHELGHAVYSKYHDSKEPYLLRAPAHAFTTEGIAMFFGRLSRNAAWMQRMLELSEEQRAKVEKVSSKYIRLQQLIFARWAMVMYDFEKELYANPDQDLDSLWWEKVGKYQLLRKPSDLAASGWASKLHFTVAPCYYHNYMLGELFASQLHYYIIHRILNFETDEGVSYVGQKKVGEFLREKVFGPGAVSHWNDMIALATGERLTPKYFVEQFVK